MLLAIDARNRGFSLGFRDGGAWHAITRIGVSPERSADEYAFFVDAAYRRAMAEGGEGGVSEAWISSVVPSLTSRLSEAVAAALGVAAMVVGPGTRTGLKIRTDYPSEVGSDLVCAAVAAREIVGKPCLVVNFGTVLSVSALDAAGDFVGASFAPGFLNAAENLRLSAAQIPEVRLSSPEKAIGRSTAQSVQSGLFIGYGGLVSRLVERMAGELVAGSQAGTASVRVVGTGGEEGRALLAAEGQGLFIPDLVLEGLAILAARA